MPDLVWINSTHKLVCFNASGKLYVLERFSLNTGEFMKDEDTHDKMQ